jgi:hypothetical protein
MSSIKTSCALGAPPSMKIGFMEKRLSEYKEPAPIFIAALSGSIELVAE